MTLSISISAIIAGLYADTALACRREREAPAILHSDHEQALRRIARDAFAFHTLSLVPYLESVHIPDDETDDVLSLDIAEKFATTAGTTSEVLRQYLTTGVTYRMLHIIYTGDDDSRASAYMALAETASDSFASVVTNAPLPAVGCRLRPSIH